VGERERKGERSLKVALVRKRHFPLEQMSREEKRRMLIRPRKKIKKKTPIVALEKKGTGIGVVMLGGMAKGVITHAKENCRPDFLERRNNNGR